MNVFEYTTWIILNHDNITETAKHTSNRVHLRGTFVRGLPCSDKRAKKRN